jgi:hypothetical protein
VGCPTTRWFSQTLEDINKKKKRAGSKYKKVKDMGRDRDFQRKEIGQR